MSRIFTSQKLRSRAVILVAAALVVAAIITWSTLFIQRRVALSAWAPAQFLGASFAGLLLALLVMEGIRAAILQRNPNRPLLTTTALMAVGFGVAFWQGFIGEGGTAALALLFVASMAAAMSVGALLGFLFGLPRFDFSARAAPSPAIATAGATTAGTPEYPMALGGRMRHRQSTNLDDVADWLTKIIVGLGLTQITKIGTVINSISDAVLRPCGPDCLRRQGFVSAIIICGAVGGFLFAYIWTRLYYGRMAARQDQKLIRELEETARAKLGVGKQVAGAPRDAITARASFEAEHVNRTGAEDVLKEQLERLTSDPNKGQFGGSANANGRALGVTVEPSVIGPGLYRVTFQLTSTMPSRPLSGSVTFYLHPTFARPAVDVPVTNGVASLTVVSYGAFTVGAVADGGATRLELDLAALPDLPEDFRAR